mmetsp:Transcript_13037/g.23775  ORF Transcript_13037/g.23775 Transcript_13037/m.23775 type:complete len:268 (+) Transcript_13037:1723-2526(+)
MISEGNRLSHRPSVPITMMSCSINWKCCTTLSLGTFLRSMGMKGCRAEGDSSMYGTLNCHLVSSVMNTISPLRMTSRWLSPRLAVVRVPSLATVAKSTVQAPPSSSSDALILSKASVMICTGSMTSSLRREIASSCAYCIMLLAKMEGSCSVVRLAVTPSEIPRTRPATKKLSSPQSIVPYLRPRHGCGPARQFLFIWHEQSAAYSREYVVKVSGAPSRDGAMALHETIPVLVCWRRRDSPTTMNKIAKTIPPAPHKIGTAAAWMKP